LLRVLDDGLDRYSSDTIARGNAVIERPYLSLLVSFTPADVLKWAGRGGPLWTNGFWARFAFTCPPPGARGTDARFPDGACNPPSDLVQTLRQWHERLGIPEVEVTERLDDAGKPLKERSWQTRITHKPAMTIGYSEPVKDAVYAYRNALRRLTEDFAVSDFDGSYSRFPEKALRVAALLASIEDSRYITMRHWARAQGIAETWRQSLHDLYQTLNTKQEEKAKREDQIVDVCTRLNGATVAQLRQYIRGLSFTEATQLSDQLVKAGVLRVEPTRKGTKRYLPVEPETN